MDRNSGSAKQATSATKTPLTDAMEAKKAAMSASADSSEITAEVIEKINDSQNVLIALSKNPSVDEMSAAIGLSLFLDKLGKRATTIYSGITPNALEFLKPEKTFEPSVDTLQDFVIALNKDKADHLRYKLDGDYVKIYITPYRTRIGKSDLDFSYGDFNVDLVLSLDVTNGIDLDEALREHGRIMHDAVIINITTGNPGKFGEIEWSDKSASSVSEMIAKLVYDISDKAPVGKEEATAFLTGIVAATNRFSNANTTPDTMQISSRLMQSGANQQLISKNITPDLDNEFYTVASEEVKKQEEDYDPTKLDIDHNESEVPTSQEAPTSQERPIPAAPPEQQDEGLLDDLREAEVSLSQAGDKTVPDTSNAPIKLEDITDDTTDSENEQIPSEPAPAVSPEPVPSQETEDASIVQAPEPQPYPVPEEPIDEPDQVLEPMPAPEMPDSESSEPALPSVSTDEPGYITEPPASEPDSAEPVPGQEGIITNDKPEKVLQPSEDLSNSMGIPEAGTEKYGKMLEDAISGLGDIAGPFPETPAPTVSENPATAVAPEVATKPEINGVPEINYMPFPGEEVLPPPPTPPIDMNAPVSNQTAPVAPATATQPIAPATPPQVPEPTSLGPQPSMQDQVYAPQAADPGAFKIPGM